MIGAMARKTKLSSPSARRLRDLTAGRAGTGQTKLVAEYQLQQTRHRKPRYRVAIPVVRAGKLRGWIGYTPWTTDRARAEHWLADKRSAPQNARATPPRKYKRTRRRKGTGGPSYDNVIRGAALLLPGQVRIVPGGLPGLGKRR
jgi:hypothetical protein